MYSVRGKRKGRRSHAAQDAASSYRRGRSLSHPSQLLPSRTDVNKTLENYHRRASRGFKENTAQLTNLENLPIELIQHIFFYCFEINLTRTSTRLAAVLSRESIYRALILFAYFDDDGLQPVETKHFLPAEYRALTQQERARLQDGITTCSWYTEDRVTQCLTILTRLRIVQSWHEEKQRQAAIESLHDRQTMSNLLHRSPKIAHLPDLDDAEALAEHFRVKNEPLADAQTIVKPKKYRLPCIYTWEFCTTNDSGYIKTLSKPVGIMNVQVLPGCLVCGTPWTSSKVSFLQLLRQASLYFNQGTVKFARAAWVRGLESAIKEGHEEALLTLLELRSSFPQIPESLCEASSLHGAPPISVSVPLSLFHQAARHTAHDSEFLWMLIRADCPSIPPNDPILTGWALRAQGRGSEPAQWLLAFISSSRTGARGSDTLLFDRGAANLSYASLEFRVDSPLMMASQQTFAQELGYPDINDPGLSNV